MDALDLGEQIVRIDRDQAAVRKLMAEVPRLQAEATRGAWLGWVTAAATAVAVAAGSLVVFSASAVLACR